MTRSGDPRPRVRRRRVPRVRHGRAGSAGRSRADRPAALPVGRAARATTSPGAPSRGGRQPGAGARPTRRRPAGGASTREAFRRYARYWFEAFDVVDWSDESDRCGVAWNGIEHLADAVAAGTGVIAALPHMGNWDAAGRSMLQRGLPVVSVAEELRPERLFRLFVEHRQALGMTIIGLDQDGRWAGSSRRRSRRTGWWRWSRIATSPGAASRSRCSGGVGSCPPARRCSRCRRGAPIVVASIYETPAGWRCVLHPLADVPRTGSRREDATALTREMAPRVRAGDLGVAAGLAPVPAGVVDRDGT